MASARRRSNAGSDAGSGVSTASMAGGSTQRMGFLGSSDSMPSRTPGSDVMTGLAPQASASMPTSGSPS